eukprot:SAG11_NODE_16089_length_557_cov_0.790393_2_plen_97_part_01
MAPAYFTLGPDASPLSTGTVPDDCVNRIQHVLSTCGVDPETFVSSLTDCEILDLVGGKDPVNSAAVDIEAASSAEDDDRELCVQLPEQSAMDALFSF